MPDLLPCPWCGSKAQVTTVWHVSREVELYRVECIKRFNGCPVNLRTHHNKTEADAITAWNTRVNQDDDRN